MKHLVYSSRVRRTMVRFVLILLFDLLVRYLSAGSTEPITLDVNANNVRVINNMPIRLTIFEPLIFKTYSDVSYEAICCHTEDKKPILKRLIEISKYNNDVSEEYMINASVPMNGTWNCNLFSLNPIPYSSDLFELKVNVQLRGNTARKLRTPSLAQNIKITQRSENGEENNNALLWLLSTIVVTGVILAVFVSIKVSMKIISWWRTSTNRLVKSSPGLSLEPMYEDLDEQKLESDAPALNVASRAPYPVPPEEKDENQKYIHYDTPYDHRFDRPMPLRLCIAHQPQRIAHQPQRTAHMLRNA